MHLKILKNTHKEADSMAWKRGRGNPFHYQRQSITGLQSRFYVSILPTNLLHSATLRKIMSKDRKKESQENLK